MIENYRLKKWRIARIPRFAAHMFAHRFVIVPAANKTRKSRGVRTRTIVKRLEQAHRNWFMRLKELVLRELWTPASEYLTEDIQEAAVKRCLYCPPTSIEHSNKRRTASVRLCGRPCICPFCYAREAEDMFRRLIKAIQQLRKTEDNLIITTRIATYTLSAAKFEEIGWQTENMFDNAGKLRRALVSEMGKYKDIRRKLSRNTSGSAWRIVVNPVDAGWEVQVRQLFITRPRAKRPVNRAKKSSAIFLQSAKLTDIQAAIDVLGAFVEYPRGLLTGYAEITAAVLHARTGLRLSNATGCFYRRNTPRRNTTEQKFLPDVP